ncbi:type II secretion system minor pseudopilin GspJ [Marinobacter zhejiangensis]|uniref:Type II secretion system protein J n=1 Tax=Marinobacter zhejiangensis TaxID=488535 RepID=A0A1I4PDP5_9GAMM|nr:type II secretion system minor pseudopilin GspJ [Marinobacter zhejiangensis]SFM25861.1 general secretion pathway protein J [Marinobacter zhejiangensis]
MTAHKHPLRRHSSQGGFTLMEVLIAVTITAVIGLGIWQVVSGIIVARDRVDAVAEQFDQVQRAFLLMERDISQSVYRPVRNLYGDTEPALTSRSDQLSLTLTRQGWRNPIGLKRSTLQRVGYEFTGDELRRRYWPVVDQGQDDSSRDQFLISDVKTFDVEFLDREQRWVSDWPSQEAMNATAESGIGSLPLPLAVRVRLEHDVFGLLERLYVLPPFDHSAVQRAMTEHAQAQSETEDETGEGEEAEPGEQPPEAGRGQGELTQ